MRRLFIWAAALLLTLDSFGQQAELYHRVRIQTGKQGLEQLSSLGIAVDHGTYRKGVSFTTDLSDTELDKVKTTGLSYTVLIEDVSRYYQERNREQSGEKPTGSGDCKACTTYPKPDNFQLGSMGGFFTYQEMLNILDSMRSRYPALITAKQPLDATTTLQGRSLYYVKISDNADNNEPEPQALYTALHHAREPESLSQLIYYMWYLLENYDNDPEIRYLVDHTEMYFVPCINPDGYVYNQANNPGGGGMWRKNRRNNGGSFGVDLNRNYGQFWGYDDLGSSPMGNTDVYRGPSAFSEPETKMIRDFCNAHQFKIALNAHTFSNLLIYPYGHVPSLETPDSAVFRSFAADMTECSRFLAGTGDQTVGYVTNGDSDDWMYGEQATKGKILAMTPEAGDEDDGFWPLSARIIPIAQQTMDQNLDAARLLTAYARIKDMDDPVIATLSSYVHTDFQRTGLEDGAFTLSLIPLTANISGTGPAITRTSPVHLQHYADSIALTLNSTVTSDPLVKYVVQWQNNTGYTHRDTVTRYYGAAALAFYSNANTLDSFEAGAWGVSTAEFTTPAGSITDSPNGDYNAGSNASIVTKGMIDLTDATAAYLTFDAKWDIEAGFDYVELAASEDGITYSPLCGRYTHQGTASQDNSTAVYDGRQLSWVKELVNLNDYAGKSIKLRFTLRSDGFVEGAGFSFDELAVHKISGTAVGIGSQRKNDGHLYAVPNPGSGSTDIHFRLPAGQTAAYLLLTDPLGRALRQVKLAPGQQRQRLDLQGLAAGVYFCRLVMPENGGAGLIKIVVQ